MTRSESEHVALRIYVGESDRRHGTPVYDWIVREARRRGLSGATVFRGIEGYGSHSRIHSTSILRLSEDLPVVVEIVDTRARIESFVAGVHDAVGVGLVTMQPIEVVTHGGGTSG